MTNDATALQERIARALYENAEYYGPAPTQPPWDWRDDEERGEWMEIAAAVLPIIARVRREAAREAEARIEAVQHLIDQADEMGEWAITCTRLQWAIDGSNPQPGA